MFSVAQRLKFIKWNLKIWKTSNGNNFKTQVANNTTKLSYVENLLISNPDSLRLNHWHKRLIKQRKKLMLFNQRFSSETMAY